MSFKKLRSVDFIVVHCAATRPDMDIGAQEIRRWHMSKGWFDIGYHKVIRRDGTREDGRPIDVPGAHALGFNHRSLAVCLVGGCAMYGPDETPSTIEWFRKYAAKAPAENNFTDAQLDDLKELLLGWKFDYPDAEILGHGDLPEVNKACPSFDVREWLDSLSE